MAIGILFESKEWSNYSLQERMMEMGVPAKLIDMQGKIDTDELLSCDLILNRVFASAVFRGHAKSHERMPATIELLRQNGIPMINSYEAHSYEVSKECSTSKLAAHGFSVPKVYGVFSPSEIVTSTEIEYPCVVKPNCGGRTNYTYIVKNHQDLCESMAHAPDMQFIAEEYIFPEYGYVTRVEVIDRLCRLISKRSVVENGLSAYRLGSTYEAYDDCSVDIKNAAVGAMDLLKIEVGSMDIIENQNGFFIIDINPASNVAEDNTEIFNFDLMKETATYVVKKYMELKNKPNE